MLQACWARNSRRTSRFVRAPELRAIRITHISVSVLPEAMKQRYSMTLDRDLMTKLDRLVDGRRFPNRSQMAEHLLTEGLKHFRPERIALILCGGLGTSVMPMPFVIPKPMVPVGYQPLLEYQISYLERYEFDEIILAVGYLQDQILRYLSGLEQRKGKIRFSFEGQPLGTGGAVKNAEKLIKHDFLTLNGDVIFDSLDLEKLFNFHEDHKSRATIVVTSQRPRARFGTVDLDDNGHVRRFLERQREGSTRQWINAGVYVLSRSVLGEIRTRKKVSLEEEVFPKLADKGELWGFKYDGYWADVGTQEDYVRVCTDIITGHVKI